MEVPLAAGETRTFADVLGSLFGLESPEAGSTFGFNLSISDNDSDAPAQETVVSASPTRTTFDNPAEWGTLVLMP